jgi:hypothetical protein
MKGTLWKISLTYINYVLMIYVNFTVNVVIVAEKKIGDIKCTNQRMHSVKNSKVPNEGIRWLLCGCNS